mmetsp:Transcript_9283/g.10605  ORF Transcript_9283/g.10605 Transcript_9283/m.10605 type:complete len:1128 (+) Transcript_9283:51-3434(+)
MATKKNDNEIVDLVDSLTDDDDDDCEILECWSGPELLNSHTSTSTNDTIRKTNESNRKDPPTNIMTQLGKKRSNTASNSTVDNNEKEDEENIMIMDPPAQTQQVTKTSRKSGTDRNSSLNMSSSSRKENVARGTNMRHPNSHSHPEDEDDGDCSDADFWKNNKASGLSKTKTSRMTSDISKIKQNKRGNKISVAVSTSDHSPRNFSQDHQFFNPYDRNSESKKKYNRTSPTEASLEQGPLSSLRNPYKKNNSKTPNSSSSTSSIDGRSSCTKVAKIRIVNPYISARKKKGLKITPPTAKANATPKSNRSESSSSSLTVPAPLSSPGGICYPKLREKTKLYADKRPNIVLAMWKHARKKVQNSYDRAELDQYANRIVDLAVTTKDFPIRSIGEYAFRKRNPIPRRGCGVSNDKYKKFEEALESTGMITSTFEVNECSDGKYFSIAEACLVAMRDVVFLRWKKQQQQTNERTHFPTEENSQLVLFSKKEYCISLVDLIPEIDVRLHPRCPSKLGRRSDADHGAAFYQEHSTRSAEFYQIKNLLPCHEKTDGYGTVKQMAYMKKRIISRSLHYQLTPFGFQKAEYISKDRIFPTEIGHYRSSNLKKIPPEYDQICLAVDMREGGASQSSRKTLHEMCNELDMKKIPYFVNTLKIGDYCFFSGNLLCPILVERKSVQDVAGSIDDGRWKSQKRKMYHGQFVFGYDNCRLAFIIEGNLKQQQVSGGYIGNARLDVREKQFNEEIKILELEGFEVIQTCHHRDSMSELAKWAKLVAKDVQSKNLNLEFTYNEFVNKVNKIPKETDFSRLAKDHAERKKQATNLRKDNDEQRKKQAVNLLSDFDAKHKKQIVDLLSDSDNDNDDTGSVNRTFDNDELRPIELNGELKESQKRPYASASATNANYSLGAQKRFKLDGDKKKETVKQRNSEIKSTFNISARDAQIKSDGKEKEDAGIDYPKWTAGNLRGKCVEYGMKKSGSKSELIARLLDKSNRPPEVYLLRKKRNLYVPVRIDVASTAILVALQIKQDLARAGANYSGATKDEVESLCDPLNIKKDPWCGGTTQRGPYHYDGWASMAPLIQPGDPPLVIKSKGRFRLSTTGDVSGLKLARAMHIWCHEKGICCCEKEGYEFNLK